MCYNYYDASRHNNLVNYLCRFKETEMKTNDNPVDVNPEGHEQVSLLHATRRLILASLGAIALGKDEVEEFVNKLVERGEIAEKDGRKLVEEAMEKRKKSVQGVGVEANRHVSELLDHLNVPTKEDIDVLSEKIALLAKKVDELTKSSS